MSDRLQLYAPFTKVEATPDGGREVWGFATAEVKDRQGEIIDFPGTVEEFAKWSAEVEKDSRSLSRGNVRRMHDNDAVGKVLEWHAGEKALEDGSSAKGIYVGVRLPPFETRAIGQVDEGILTGFSIGGSYAKRWYDAGAQAYRYVPVLAELSLVDRPAVPVATFDLVKSVNGRMVVAGMHKAADGEKTEREKLHEAAEARAKKYGIGIKEGGALTPPKGYPDDEDKYGDPVNYRYPFDEPRKRAAVTRFNDPANREKGGYSEEEWEKIGKRIAEGIGGHEFKDGKIEATEEEKEAEKAALAGALAKAQKGDGLSHDDIRALIYAAIRGKSGPFEDSMYVNDVYDDHFIASDYDERKSYDIPYEIKDGGAVLGEPVEVRQTWTPVKEAEMAMTDEDLAKLADLVAARIAKGGKKDPDGDGDDDANATSDKDPDHDGDNEEREDTEKAAQAATLLKSVTARLEKRGVAVSAKRRKHMRHALDHIHAALGNDEEIEDGDHIAMSEGRKPSGDMEGEAEKAVQAAVRKALDTALAPESLAKSVGAALAGAGLAKAADIARITEELGEVRKSITSVQSQVKEIADTPQQGGAFTGMPPVPGNGGSLPWMGVEKDVLAGLQQRTTDPVLKDALGRHLAASVLASAYGAAGTRDPSS